MTSSKSYSIGTMAAAAGVSRRTVRFYVQRELLPPPEGLGRGAHYTDEHLARLLQIKGWQEQGVALDEIRARLHGKAVAARERHVPVHGASGPAAGWRRADLPRPASRIVTQAPGSGWFRQPLAAGFELHVTSGNPPLSARQLAALASALSDILEKGTEQK